MDWRDAESAADDPFPGATTLSVLFERSADRHADAVAQRYRGGVARRSLVESGVVSAAPEGGYADLTYARLRELVRHLAAGFRDAGVEPGDRVALVSSTRMEWAQVDLAVLAAGGVVTPIFPSATARSIRYRLADAGATAAVVEDADLLDRVEAALAGDVDEGAASRDRTPADADRPAVDPPAVDPLVTIDATGRDAPTLGTLTERGRERFDPAAHDSRLAAREGDDLASLLYTSGTTGQPKGVPLTHGNLRANVAQCYRRLGPRSDRGWGVVDPETTMLSVLPLAHIYERLVGQFLPLSAGATVAYAESPATLARDLRAARPTTVTGVPRLYEKLLDGARAAAAERPLGGRLFDWAVRAGRACAAAADPGPVLRAKARLADRLVVDSVRDAFGGRLEYLISGGGALPPDVGERYRGLGLTVLEGYGLTETAPVVAVNPPEAPRIGTVGPPVPDQEVRLDADAVPGVSADGDEAGELLARGPNVVSGYWNRPAATDDAFTADGWFRTGDVVERDDDGYLVFRRRAEQLLVLSTGKNVAPRVVEDAVEAGPLVDQCLALGDDRRYVAALVVPDVDRARAWAEREGVDLPDDPAAVRTDERVRTAVGEWIERANERLDPHERVREFATVPEPFTGDNGLLTPTMKKKRRHILERHADAVAALYDRD